ncbi:MAG: DUF4239 domain-containing protein [Candidatus Eremiobacteraeota bacterium]|nr:DUF4239 domain-containing protein [Candidatus Eremiobacteraeota bacterium]
MTWIFPLPTWLSMVVAVVVMGGGAAALHRLLNRRGWRGFREHNDIVGFILTVVGAIYAVVLGFVAVIVWQQYETSRETEQREINSLSALYELANAYPQRPRAQLQTLIVAYVNRVVQDEWPAMRRGKDDPAADAAARRLGAFAVELQRGATDNVASETLALARRIADARAQRLQDNQNGIPVVLWIALIAGAVITIGFGYLFGIENERLHALATACIAGIVAIMLVLIARLDFPYRGDTGIPPTDWQVALRSMPPPR